MPRRDGGTLQGAFTRRPTLLSTIILVSHWLIVAALSVRVILRRRPVGVSMAWLVVLFSIPFFGVMIYLLFGEPRLGRRRMSRTMTHASEAAGWQARLPRATDTVPAGAAALSRQAERVLGQPVLGGNALSLLTDADAFFTALLRDVAGARSTVDAGFYIWDGRGRGGEVVEALIQAAGRGVRCRVLADGMGSKEFLRGPEAARLRAAGVALTAALPTGLLRALLARADLRNHRKIVVIDGDVAYTGSQNLVDPRWFHQQAGVGEWVDAMLRLEGPAAAALCGVFALDWSIENDLPFAVPSAPAAPAAGALVQVAPSGPGLHPEAIHQLLLSAIYSAHEELVLTTPYFVPEESMLTALLSAALRGVAVTLIVPAHNDSLMVRYASVAHFDDLMAAGVHIARFRGGLLHTKSLTIDGQSAVIGSVNLDMRSLWLNFEISLLIYDAEFTRRLRALQGQYLCASEPLDPVAWRARPGWRRFVEDTFRLLGPLL